MARAWAALLVVWPAVALGDEVLVFEGEVDASDSSRFLDVPFDVPAGVAEIEVRHDDLSEANILDWGLADPVRFRGWGGGNTEPAIVGLQAASRSYLPGPMPAGRWRVRIGEALVEELPARYHVEVVLRDAPTLEPQSEREPYVPTTPLDVGPRWYAGDLHVHSRESGDADPTLDEVADFARSRGLDFVELSDHNTVSQLELMVDAQARHPELLFVPGVEFTTYQGHANGIGATEWVDSAVGTPGVTILGAARAFADQGAVFSINHPTLELDDFCIGCAWGWDLPLEWVGALEISTGSWSTSGRLLAPAAMEMWDEMSRAGHRVTAVGGSDDHGAGQRTGGFSSHIGSPTTMVWAEELTAAAIVDGIRAGRTVVKLEGPDDPMIDLAWSVPPDSATIVAPSVHLTITVTGGGDRLQLLVDGATTERVEIDDDPFVHEVDLTPPTEGESFVRAQVVVADAPRTVTSNVFLRRGAAPAIPPQPAAASGGGCSTPGAPAGGIVSMIALALAAARRRPRGPAR